MREDFKGLKILIGYVELERKNIYIWYRKILIAEKHLNFVTKIDQYTLEK